MQENAVEKPREDAEVQRMHGEAVALKEYAEARVIATDADQRNAGNDLVLIKNLRKAMEERRVFFTKPLNDQLKEINGDFKALMAPVVEADDITQQKIKDYIKEQQRKRAEEEEINRLRMEAARKEMELKGELTEPVDLVEVSAAPPKTVHADVGDIGQRINWKWELVDKKLVPEDYKMLNETLIGKVVRDGIRDIPGIRIYPEASLVTRPAKFKESEPERIQMVQAEDWKEGL